MFNNLDRYIAVVGGTSDSTLSKIIAEFDCLPRHFEAASVSQIVAGEFDAIIFDDIDIDIDIENTKHIAAVLREMNSEFKPIAVIGRSYKLVQEIFGSRVEFAAVTKTRDDDYISDRDFKILSTSGKDSKGIRRMLRELTEMA